MLETCRCLVLNEDEIAAQAALLPNSCLHVTDSVAIVVTTATLVTDVHKIIYLGKNEDKWGFTPTYGTAERWIF